MAAMSIAALLLPARCAVCGALGRSPVRRRAWARCGRHRCSSRPPGLDSLVALVRYDDVARAAGHGGEVPQRPGLDRRAGPGAGLARRPRRGPRSSRWAPTTPDRARRAGLRPGRAARPGRGPPPRPPRPAAACAASPGVHQTGRSADERRRAPRFAAPGGVPSVGAGRRRRVHHRRHHVGRGRGAAHGRGAAPFTAWSSPGHRPARCVGRLDVPMGIFDKLLRAGEGKKVKALQALVPEINALEPEMEALSDDALAGQDRRVPRAARQRRRPRRPPDRGLRRRPRGRPPRDRPAPLRRAADGRRRPALRLGRRDEDRRGQDPRLHAAGLPQRPRRQGRARHHGQRLPGHPRRRVDGPDPQLARPHRRPRDPRASSTPTTSGRSTPATSPTAPTTSSASTTCATTWP